MIIVMGHIHLAPSDVHEFSSDVQGITPGTDAGCLLYAVSLVGPAAGQMLVTERWQSQAALTSHLGKQTTLAFLQKWAGKLRSEVLKYDALNERPLVD